MGLAYSYKAEWSEMDTWKRPLNLKQRKEEDKVYRICGCNSVRDFKGNIIYQVAKNKIYSDQGLKFEFCSVR